LTQKASPNDAVMIPTGANSTPRGRVWRSSGERVIDALGVHDGVRKVYPVVIDEVHDGGEIGR
jgi:hypothetical protein